MQSSLLCRFFHLQLEYGKIQLIEKEEVTMTNQQQNNELPPKTGTVEKLVTVKEDIQKVLEGKKTATRRNGRYADVGEVMTLEGRDFVVERVYSQSLGELTDENARQEGFDSLEDYKQSILSIHP